VLLLLRSAAQPAAGRPQGQLPALTALLTGQPARVQQNSMLTAGWMLKRSLPALEREGELNLAKLEAGGSATLLIN
jgi:hypothetical protein